MDKYVKQSIDARREAIGAAYQLDEVVEKKVNELFGEIESLGAECRDVGEFEAEFIKSPLNQRYLDLFTEIATSAQPVSRAGVGMGVKGVGAVVGDIVAEGIVEGAADRVLSEAERAVLPTRAAVHQKAYDEVRKVPGLGDAIDIGQKAGYVAHLGKLFGKKRKGQDESED